VPDLTGAKTPKYLLALLNASANANGLERPESAFALSAKVWEKSTQMSMRNILARRREPGIEVVDPECFSRRRRRVASTL